MQVLEQILEEIEKRINHMVVRATECVNLEEYAEADVIDHTISGLEIATQIIRSHMGVTGMGVTGKRNFIDIQDERL